MYQIFNRTKQVQNLIVKDKNTKQGSTLTLAPKPKTGHKKEIEDFQITEDVREKDRLKIIRLVHIEEENNEE